MSTTLSRRFTLTVFPVFILHPSAFILFTPGHDRGFVDHVRDLPIERPRWLLDDLNRAPKLNRLERLESPFPDTTGTRRSPATTETIEANF